jgi:hypothetical protein
MPKQGEPGHFSLSAPFDRLLAEFEVEVLPDDGGEDYINIVHSLCGDVVTRVDNGDGLVTLIQLVIDHEC